MESQFALAKITVSETKFHRVMAVLPEDLVSEILTDEVTNYKTLKSAIIEHLRPKADDTIIKSRLLTALPVH